MFDDNWIYIHDPSVKVGRDPKFQILVAGNGAGSGQGLLRPGIFLFRTRRAVGFER